MTNLASTVCKLGGAAFVLVGIWGFASGGGNVLAFSVNAAHNCVHLISGLVALACGFESERASRLFSLVFGSAYGIVAILGLAGVQPIVDMLQLNAADNWLHVAIAAGFLVVGVLSHAPLRTGGHTTGHA
jgi:hypothetical protein